MIQIPTPTSTETPDSAEAVLAPPTEVVLHLSIRDQDLCRELAEHAEGRPRQEFAIAAMRIGALAMRHAQGRIDAENIREEGTRMVTELGRTLSRESEALNERLVAALGAYFDPDGGRFTERVERLVRGGGDLEELLSRHLGPDNSTLSSTLQEHLGESSPLMSLLNPSEECGLVAEMGSSLDRAILAHREALLREFSLDNKDGALARLIKEVDELQKGLGEDVSGVVEKLAKEFTLDREDSALSRLVHRVEASQAALAREFSLDREDSALARIRRELTQALEAQRKTNEAFQTEVREAVAALSARRAEVKRSTRHGTEFEDQAFGVIRDFCQARGDIATPTGNTVGRLPRSKKGDAVIELGPEHRAAGARVATEMKGNKSYTLKSALEEMAEARENREASVGVFVFAPHAAPDGQEPLERYGRDIVVVWDAEDPATDIRLHAALHIARALATQLHVEKEETDIDFAAMDQAVSGITNQITLLEAVETHCKRAIKNNEDALKQTEKVRSTLSDQVAVLEESIEGVKVTIGRGEHERA